jgi:hypothetical protein
MYSVRLLVKLGTARSITLFCQLRSRLKGSMTDSVLFATPDFHASSLLIAVLI